MPGKTKTPERANGDLRPETFRLGGTLNAHELALLAATLGPQAFVILGIVVSANWAVVGGANPYLAYGFGSLGLLSNMILAVRSGCK